jgi:hypothetical protein
VKDSKIVNSIFSSAASYGCDEIIRSKLGLKGDWPLPITIPHGIDFHHLKVDLDLHCHEPIYIAFRDDIADRVAKVKAVLKFPHPWLLIVSEEKSQRGLGTLFITPPPSLKNYEAMWPSILEGDFPKPWGVLIKERGAQREHFLWWESKGFAAHSAGKISEKQFFYALRDIFAKYEYVASPNMSSAVIFAVAMNRCARALPNVRVEYIDAGNWVDLAVLDDRDGKIAEVWRALLSDDLKLARSQAEHLLGAAYMGKPEELRARLLKAVEAVADRPVHLFPIRNRLLYKICIWLMAKNIPLHKLFPNPVRKIANRALEHLRLNRLTICSGSDFSHYDIAGDHATLQFRKVFAFRLGKGAMPGQAVRNGG